MTVILMRCRRCRRLKQAGIHLRCAGCQVRERFALAIERDLAAGTTGGMTGQSLALGALAMALVILVLLVWWLVAGGF